MKTFFLALFFFAFSAVAKAEGKGMLVLELCNGQTVSFQLENQPVITFAESEMIVSERGGFSNKFPMSDIVKYTFSDVSTDIDNVGNDGNIKIFQDGDNLKLSNLKHGQELCLYSTGGILVKKGAASADGRIAMSLHDVPNGVYIVKIATFTYKILKK